jgi:hypothetical protein
VEKSPLVPQLPIKHFEFSSFRIFVFKKVVQCCLLRSFARKEVKTKLSNVEKSPFGDQKMEFSSHFSVISCQPEP